ncbi:hypothetical protein BjapCC829_48980 (plasmid) [Bradyrhizobium barranii]|uniref:Uncharacterized protein n=1 Tax=Bradyrhizobium barranii TaxID=2992140 RepID=A0ABY3R227_9BRAD|nr:hypothetical protein [Bradyrhizobium japonicum]UFW91943.1 hypothetical protein BjapCC829_48980 [Bradyrhizobium japonicum]
MTPLNIRVFVDVVDLLLRNTVDSNVFMFDDGSCRREGLGTSKLVSSVWPGQLVRWSLTPLDVQTMAWLTGVSFDGNAPAVTGGALPWTLHWQGYAPTWIPPGSHHAYRLTLVMGALSGRTVSIEGPSLFFVPPPQEGAFLAQPSPTPVERPQNPLQ